MRISDWSSDVCSSDLCPALSAITFALLRLTTLLVVVDFLEVGIDDAVLALGATALAGRGGVTAGRAVTGLALLIERLADLHGDLLQGLRLGLDGLEVVAPVAVFNAAMACSSAVLSAVGTFSPASAMVFSVVWISDSAWFFASTRARRALSFSALISASFTICSISASMRPLEDRKSTRLNSSHSCASRMPSSA